MYRANRMLRHLRLYIVRYDYDVCFLTLSKYTAIYDSLTNRSKQAVRVATQYARSLLPVGAQTPRAPPSRRNVAVLSHAEYVPTLTAAAAPSKAAW